MPELIPIDYDPFKAPPRIIPVDHDPFASLAPAPKAGQSAAQPNVAAQLAAGPGRVRNFLGDVTGITDAMRAWRGQMTEDEAKQFALLGAATILAPEARGMGMVAKVAEEAGPEAAKAVAKSIRAFHASPHDFERFDISKIGTGEGAQSYGHGLYFAENPQTAEEYFKYFQGRMIPGASTGRSKYLVKGQELPSGISGHAALDTGGDMDMLLGMMHQNPDSTMIPYLKQKIEDRIANHYTMTSSGSAGDDMRAMANFYNRYLKNAAPEDVTPRPTPKRYEVAINADPEHFLDWDKPLSEQHPKVQQKIESEFGKSVTRLANDVWKGLDDRWYTVQNGEAVGNMKGWPDEATARGALKVIQEQKLPQKTIQEWLKSSPGAEARLREAGIPGIKYLDQGSRPTQASLAAQDALLKRIAIEEKTLVSMQKNAGTPSVSAAFSQDEIASQINRQQDFISDLKSKITSAPKPTSNFVIFDDRLIDIIKKYGLAGLVAGGAAHFSTTPVEHDPFAE